MLIHCLDWLAGDQGRAMLCVWLVRHVEHEGTKGNGQAMHGVIDCHCTGLPAHKVFQACQCSTCCHCRGPWCVRQPSLPLPLLHLPCYCPSVCTTVVLMPVHTMPPRKRRPDAAPYLLPGCSPCPCHHVGGARAAAADRAAGLQGLHSGRKRLGATCRATW